MECEWIKRVNDRRAGTYLLALQSSGCHLAAASSVTSSAAVWDASNEIPSRPGTL